MHCRVHPPSVRGQIRKLCTHMHTYIHTYHLCMCVCIYMLYIMYSYSPPLSLPPTLVLTPCQSCLLSTLVPPSKMPSLWPSSPSPLVSPSRGCLPRRTTTPSVPIKCVGGQLGVWGDIVLIQGRWYCCVMCEVCA